MAVTAETYVFTLPPAAAEIAFQNKQTVYDARSAQALAILAVERLGARIGSSPLC
jgi:hypothetical protein